MYNQNEQSPVIKAVRAMVTSPLFLVGAIGYSVYALFELLSSITGGSDLSSLLNNISRMSGNYGMDYGYIQTYMGAYNGIRVMIALLMAIPVILIVVGIWLTFASARSNSQPGISVTGLTIIRVIVIIQLVCAGIGFVLLELLCIVVMAGANAAMRYYSSGSSMGYMIVFIMIGIAVVSAVEILYYLKLGKSISMMKEVITSGMPNSQVSLYVEIFCYIVGGVSAISALMSLAGMSVYGFLANAGLATANISFAIFLRKYRQNMEQLLNHPGAAAYAQPYQNQGQPEYQQSYQEAAQPGYPQQPYQNQGRPGQAPSNYQQSYQNQGQPEYQQSYQEAVQPGYPQQPYQNQGRPGQAPSNYQQPYQNQGQPEYQQSYQEAVQPGYPQQPYQNQGRPGQGQSQAAYGQENETTVLPYYNETSVLSGQFMTGGRMQLVRMTRQKTGETICISKPSFWIGKDAVNVDYCITDNTAVSRRHALVTIQNNGCYVRDNHSTNRVFVNGQIIEPDIDTPLSDGNRVRMGDEEFVVSIG